ncbi:hypothetical protein [Aquiflexum sp.]|uniref:hypothetical protein n=1 Tax=Aquiflexum sp. TaxID=1872584 RepID=UPI00359416B2
MKKQRIYLDTSVFGGLFDEEFKEIVNVVRIIGYNAVNVAEGYKQIDIRSPRELLTYED